MMRLHSALHYKYLCLLQIKVDSSSSLKTMVSENHLKLLEAALRQTDMPGY